MPSLCGITQAVKHQSLASGVDDRRVLRRAGKNESAFRWTGSRFGTIPKAPVVDRRLEPQAFGLVVPVGVSLYTRHECQQVPGVLFQQKGLAISQPAMQPAAGQQSHDGDHHDEFQQGKTLLPYVVSVHGRHSRAWYQRE